MYVCVSVGFVILVAEYTCIHILNAIKCVFQFF